jgi:hypothetical protein
VRSGFSTLLMPDVQQWQPAPGPTLAVAATLADLRVGTWVYSSPLRMPWSMAWEAHSLSVLTEGRFEMGIGTGRPGIEDELRELGLPVVTPGERLSQVRDTVTPLRELTARTSSGRYSCRPSPGQSQDRSARLRLVTSLDNSKKRLLEYPRGEGKAQVEPGNWRKTSTHQGSTSHDMRNDEMSVKRHVRWHGTRVLTSAATVSTGGRGCAHAGMGGIQGFPARASRMAVMTSAPCLRAV